MRLVLLPILVALLCGCSVAAKPTAVDPIKITSREEIKLVTGYRSLKRPRHRELMQRTLEKCSTEQERETRLARNLTIAACGLLGLAGIGALLKLLGAL